jgi:hypothetical protein
MLADTDPHFRALHPDLRSVIRTSETVIGNNIRASLSGAGFDEMIPAELRPVMQAKYEQMAATLTEAFLRGHMDLYALVSDALHKYERITTPTVKTVS